MSTALLIIAIVLAALACPAMMWLSQRRGRASACCPESSTKDTLPHPDEPSVQGTPSLPAAPS